MAKASEKNQKSDAENPQVTKKKVARKRVVKSPEKAVSGADAQDTVVKQDDPAKKKTARKRVVKMPDAVVDAGSGAADSLSVPPGENPQTEMAASSPKSGEVHRQSQKHHAERPEDGEKKRRRRRRRRGGEHRDEEPRSEPSEDLRLPEQPSHVREEEKDGDALSPRVKVRQPEIQRQHDRRPPRYTENSELLTEYAWQIYKGEIREEGGTLIDDRDAKKIAERAFRMAEIFLMEQSRLG